MEKSDTFDPGWRWMAVLGAVLALVIYVYPLTLGIPLLDPDEGLHASIAQEMVERGDWVTPRLLGEPFLDKPIFYFWAEALSLRTFGMNEAAVRFPGLMFGLLGAVTTGVVGWRMFSRAVGLLAGLFYATTILPAALAQAAVHDVALVPVISLAVLLFWESDTAATRRAAVAYTVAIGVLLGLTCLIKGLVGVALIGVAYGTYLLLTRRLTIAACIRGAAALAIAALVASPWYIAVELNNPGYLHYYFVQRHLLGYTTGTQTHGTAPWWYYLPILIGGGLPWLAYLPVTLRDDWARRRRLGGWGKAQSSPSPQPNEEERGGKREEGREKREKGNHASGLPSVPPPSSLLPPLSSPPRSRQGSHPSSTTGHPGATPLLWCWLIGCTLFLSTSHSKLVTYIWPVFPAVAILAAVAWMRLLEGTLSDAARRLLLGTFSLTCLTGAALLPGALLVVQTKFPVELSWQVWAIVATVAIGSWMSLGFLAVGRYRTTLCSGMLSLAAQYAVIITVLIPPIAATTSARDLADHFNRLDRVPRRLLLTDDRLGSLVFYLKPRLRAALQPGQFQEIPLDGLQEFPKMEPGTVAALPERGVPRAARYLDLRGIAYRSVGRYRLYNARDLETRLVAAAERRGPAPR